MSIWVIIGMLVLASTIVTSFIHYDSLKAFGLRSFAYFLLFVLLGELTGIILARTYHTNILFYSIFTSLQIIYYLYIIQSSIFSSIMKKVIAALSIIFFVVSVINCFFFQNINTELISYTFSIGSLFITFTSLYFFYELLRSDQIASYTTYLPFWIILGLFIFYTCNIPYMSVYNYLSVNYKTILNAYYKIIEILAYIMYVFFTIGLIWSSKRK